MTPVPEPAADLVAQLAAVVDPEHPKRAMLVVPGNAVPAELPDHVYVCARVEGTLITGSAIIASLFDHVPTMNGALDDASMASILGYPEDKSEVIQNCAGDLTRALAVQARDAAGNVVTEAFASPPGLFRTATALTGHVPSGGYLVTLTPAASITRRLALRAKEEMEHA